MALVHHANSLLGEERGRQLCSVKLSTGKQLITKKDDIHMLMPVLLYEYPTYDSDKSVWDAFMAQTSSVARHCNSIVQLLVAFHPKAVSNIKDCMLDNLRTILPVHQAIFSKTACPSCGNYTQYEMPVQLRSGDEDTSIITFCTTCNAQ